jgi:hypothetical protein
MKTIVAIASLLLTALAFAQSAPFAPQPVLQGGQVVPALRFRLYLPEQGPNRGA